MSRRLRITLIAISATVLVVLASALVLAYVMLRPERFTRSLRASANEAGLELNLTAPAHPTLWPRPGVRLEGLQLFVQGQSNPLLVADGGRIVVPWRTVLGGDAAITTLELDAPRLDLGQLQRALANLPVASGQPPTLPRIDTGITIRNGALVRDNRLLLQDIDLHTGALTPRRPFTLDAQAQWDSGKQGLLKLQFTPRTAADGGIVLDELRLGIRSGKQAGAQLQGTARWSGGERLQLNLAGTMQAQAGNPYRVSLQSDAPVTGTLHMKIDGPSGRADMHLSPQHLSNWWQSLVGTYRPGALTPPPLKGSVDADELDMGDIHIKGLKLRSDIDAPASAGTASPPPKGAGK
jgi:uncharacterized protein involved in outer membrane biogenesis